MKAPLQNLAISPGDSMEEVVFFQKTLLTFRTENCIYNVSAAIFISYRPSPSSGGQEVFVARFLCHLIKILRSLSVALFSSSSSLDHHGHDLSRLLGGHPCPFVLGQLNSRALLMSVSQDLSSRSKASGFQSWIGTHLLDRNSLLSWNLTKSAFRKPKIFCFEFWIRAKPYETGHWWLHLRRLSIPTDLLPC